MFQVWLEEHKKLKGLHANAIRPDQRSKQSGETSTLDPIVGPALLMGSVLIAFATQKRGQGGPLEWSLWVLAGALAIPVVAPLGLTYTSVTAGIIVVVGIISLASPTLFSLIPKGALRAEPVNQGRRSVGLAKLVFLSAVMLMLVAVGFQAFKSDIASATGLSFDQLSPTEIRAAQTSNARGGGILALMGSAGPILACLGLYGALRFSRWWYLLSAVSVWVALQSPARLTVVSLILVMAVFYLYARRSMSEGPTQKKLRKRTVFLIVGGAGGGALAIFNLIGAQLGKNQSATALFPHFTWPQWSLNPLLYFGGGFPALSQALDLRVNPFDAGGSFFSVMKVANVFFPDIQVPDTIGRYVGIPIQFNLYTGFGQVYFDVGLIGVIGAFVLLGWLSGLAHRWAMEGRLEWAFASAVLATVLLSLPQSYILFHLDLIFQLVIGFWVFWAIRYERRLRGVLEPARRKNHRFSSR